MSKEYLEAFRNLETLKDTLIGNGINDNINDYVDNLILPIKQALQHLEAIDNSSPSEALECLEHIKKDDFNMIITTYPPLPAYNGVTKDEMFDKIEQVVLKAQEMEKENVKLKGQVKYLTEVGTELQKILSIIKEKNVDIGYLKWCLNEYEGDMALIVYNGHQNIVKAYELTIEEFDLLKRWLER